VPERDAHQVTALVMDYLNDPAKLEGLRAGARALAQPRAAQEIVDHVERLWTWKP